MPQTAVQSVTHTARNRVSRQFKAFSFLFFCSSSFNHRLSQHVERERVKWLRLTTRVAYPKDAVHHQIALEIYTICILFSSRIARTTYIVQCTWNETREQTHLLCKHCLEAIFCIHFVRCQYTFFCTTKRNGAKNRLLLYLIWYEKKKMRKRMKSV